MRKETIKIMNLIYDKVLFGRGPATQPHRDKLNEIVLSTAETISRVGKPFDVEGTLKWTGNPAHKLVLAAALVEAGADPTQVKEGLQT